MPCAMISLLTNKRSDQQHGAKIILDLNLIERGADYKKLKKSFIIFICTFDAFGKGLHKYTFENACREEPSLTLQDESVKIFLCTEGVKNDVSEQLLMFLRYVAGAKPEGELPERIEERVGRARSHEEWRREYMTLQMRDLENQEIGMELGEKARAVKTAQTMLEQQEPMEKIGLYTGLSREEIAGLAGERTSI